MAQESHKPASYQYGLDIGLAGLMPSTWSGHARIKAFELADERDLSDEQKEFAMTLANRLSQKGNPTNKSATKAVAATIKKLA